MKAHLTLKSQLNPDVWENMLKDYWEDQLCAIIRFGFPLDFDRDSPL